MVTDDEYLYNLMLSIRSHGWGRDVDRVYHDRWSEKYGVDEVRDLYTFYYPGFNLRSTDLNAFIGLSQLEKIDSICKKRHDNFNIYAKRLNEFWIQNSQTEFLSSFAFGVLVENRLEVYKHLSSKGIETRPLICGNLGRHPFWMNKNGELSLPNADVVHNYGLYLPNHCYLTESDIFHVCDTFLEVAKIKRF